MAGLGEHSAVPLKCILDEEGDDRGQVHGLLLDVRKPASQVTLTVAPLLPAHEQKRSVDS